MSDDLHYEDFDDVPFPEPADDLDAIDLDAADEGEAVETPAEPPPSHPPVTPHLRPLPPAPERPHAKRPPEGPPPQHIARQPNAEPEDDEEFTPPHAASDEVTGAATEPSAEAPDASEPLPLDHVLAEAASIELGTWADEAPAPESALPEAALDDLAPEAEPGPVDYAALPVEDIAPDLVACVVLALPPDFAAEVEGLREASGVEALPLGIVLAGPFRAPDFAAVEEALDAWAQAHLPLAVETAGVVAEVIDAQRYVAAWMLQPADRLRRLCATLQHALAPLIEPAEELPPAVRLVVGDHVRADRYPRLIARMQRAFEPQAWQASTLALAQRHVGDPASAWEVVWVSA